MIGIISTRQNRIDYSKYNRLNRPREPPMFRFTIRDVLWLTVVVALALGWWVDHRRIRSLEFEALRWELRASSRPITSRKMLGRRSSFPVTE